MTKTDLLSTGIIQLQVEDASVVLKELNKAANKLLGWDLKSLNEHINKLEGLSPSLASLARLLKELQTFTEINKVYRKEIRLNGQYLNAFIQKTDDANYLIELSPIIYQDMKQSTHELKRPIQNIKTLVETLQIGAKDDPIKCEEYLSKLNYEADRLGSLVQDMLSLSHVINGSIELNKSKIKVKARVQKLLESAQSRADGKNITLVNKADELELEADSKLFDHLVSNLVDNGIKYNKENGKVSVSYDGNKLIIADTGLGIPKEDQPKIFEQFYRVSGTEDIQGSGLGLAIVKGIIELHGWDIEIKSEPGEGTSFAIIVS